MKPTTRGNIFRSVQEAGTWEPCSYAEDGGETDKEGRERPYGGRVVAQDLVQTPPVRSWFKQALKRRASLTCGHTVRSHRKQLQTHVSMLCAKVLVFVCLMIMGVLCLLVLYFCGEEFFLKKNTMDLQKNSLCKSKNVHVRSRVVAGDELQGVGASPSHLPESFSKSDPSVGTRMLSCPP